KQPPLSLSLFRQPQPPSSCLPLPSQLPLHFAVAVLVVMPEGDLLFLLPVLPPNASIGHVCFAARPSLRANGRRHLRRKRPRHLPRLRRPLERSSRGRSRHPRSLGYQPRSCLALLLPAPTRRPHRPTQRRAHSPRRDRAAPRQNQPSKFLSLHPKCRRSPRARRLPTHPPHARLSLRIPLHPLRQAFPRSILL